MLCFPGRIPWSTVRTVLSRTSLCLVDPGFRGPLAAAWGYHTWGVRKVTRNLPLPAPCTLPFQPREPCEEVAPGSRPHSPVGLRDDVHRSALPFSPEPLCSCSPPEAAHPSSLGRVSRSGHVPVFPCVCCCFCATKTELNTYGKSVLNPGLGLCH